MFDKTIIITIIGMFLVTYIPRVFPVIILSKYKTGDAFNKIIKYIPISVFVGLITKEVLFIDGNINLSTNNVFIVPTIIVFIISAKYKSIGLSIVSGIASIAIASYIF